MLVVCSTICKNNLEFVSDFDGTRHLIEPILKEYFHGFIYGHITTINYMDFSFTRRLPGDTHTFRSEGDPHIKCEPEPDNKMLTQINGKFPKDLPLQKFDIIWFADCSRIIDMINGLEVLDRYCHRGTIFFFTKPPTETAMSNEKIVDMKYRVSEFKEIHEANCKLTLEEIKKLPKDKQSELASDIIRYERGYVPTVEKEFLNSVRYPYPFVSPYLMFLSGTTNPLDNIETAKKLMGMMRRTKKVSGFENVPIYKFDEFKGGYYHKYLKYKHKYLMLKK